MSYQLFLFSLLIPNTYNTSIYHLNKAKKFSTLIKRYFYFLYYGFYQQFAKV